MEIVAVLAGLALLAGATGWVWLRSRAQPEEQRMRMAPKTLVRDAPAGTWVKVVGRVRGTRDGLRAPISGTPCAAYEVEVRLEPEVPVDGARGVATLPKAAVPTAREISAGAVVVVDESGTAWVPMRGARLALGEVLDGTAEPETHASEAIEAILVRKGMSMHAGGWGRRLLRYRQCVLEEGALVAVFGTAAWEYDPDAKTTGEGYRDRPRRLRLDPPRGGRVVISDDPSHTG